MTASSINRSGGGSSLGMSPTMSTSSIGTQQRKKGEREGEEERDSGEAEILQLLLQDQQFLISNDIPQLCQQWQYRLDEITNENVKSLLDLSERSQNIVPLMTKAVQELQAVEQQMATYADHVRMLGRDLQKVEIGSNTLTVQRHNLESLTLDLATQKLLEQPAFENQLAIEPLAKAAQQLHDLMQQDRRGLGDMKAVMERLTELKTLQEQFYSKLLTYLTKVFQVLSESTAKKSSASTSATSNLANFEALGQFLQKYTPIITVMQQSSTKAFNDLIKAFLLTLQGVLKRDLQIMGDNVKSMHVQPIDLQTQGQYLFPFPTTTSFIPGGTQLKSIFKEVGQDVPPLTSEEILSTVVAVDYVFLIFLRALMHLHNVLSQLIPDNRQLKRMSGALLDSLMSDLELTIRQFLDSIFKIDHLASAVEVWMTISLRSHQCPSEVDYLVRKALDRLLAYCKSKCEQLMDLQCQGIREQRVMPKKRLGLLPYVVTLPKFISHYEQQLAKRCSERDDLKAYLKALGVPQFLGLTYRRLGEAIFHNLERIPQDALAGDDKEQMNASVMTIENAHYLTVQLPALNIKHLEQLIKDATSAYTTHLKSYAIQALHVILHDKFIDYMDSLVKAIKSPGVKPHELVYSQSYNKMACKKALSIISEKDVRSGLEKTFQRLDKHFTDPLIRDIVAKHVAALFFTTCQGYMEALSKVYHQDPQSQQEFQLPFNAEQCLQAYYPYRPT